MSTGEPAAAPHPRIKPRIRPERPSDAEAVAAVIRAAFGDGGNDEGAEVAAIWSEISAADLPHQGRWRWTPIGWSGTWD